MSERRHTVAVCFVVGGMTESSIQADNRMRDHNSQLLHSPLKTDLARSSDFAQLPSPPAQSTHSFTRPLHNPTQISHNGPAIASTMFSNTNHQQHSPLAVAAAPRGTTQQNIPPTLMQQPATTSQSQLPKCSHLLTNTPAHKGPPHTWCVSRGWRRGSSSSVTGR